MRFSRKVSICLAIVLSFAILSGCSENANNSQRRNTTDNSTTSGRVGRNSQSADFDDMSVQNLSYSNQTPSTNIGSMMSGYYIYRPDTGIFVPLASESYPMERETAFPLDPLRQSYAIPFDNIFESRQELENNLPSIMPVFRRGVDQLVLKLDEHYSEYPTMFTYSSISQTAGILYDEQSMTITTVGSGSQAERAGFAADERYVTRNDDGRVFEMTLFNDGNPILLSANKSDILISPPASYNNVMLTEYDNIFLDFTFDNVNHNYITSTNEPQSGEWGMTVSGTLPKEVVVSLYDPTTDALLPRYFYCDDSYTAPVASSPYPSPAEAPSPYPSSVEDPPQPEDVPYSDFWARNIDSFDWSAYFDTERTLRLAISDITSNRHRTIAANGYIIVGVRSDGTVVAAINENDTRAFALSIKNTVSEWRDIVSVVANYDSILGLKSDGTVVHTGERLVGGSSRWWHGWRDIVAIASDGIFAYYGLKSDGTVVSSEDYLGVSGWSDIVAIEATPDRIVGLKHDGTVLFEGYYFGDTAHEDWRDIVAVSLGSESILGLKSDGTVVVSGYRLDRFYDVLDLPVLSYWRGIVGISVIDGNAIGITSRGTVISTNPRYDTSEQYSVNFNLDSNFINIVAIDIHEYNWDEYLVIGLNSDGTVVSYYNGYGINNRIPHFNLSDFRDIKIP